jgi:hypothetical protein
MIDSPHVEVPEMPPTRCPREVTKRDFPERACRLP